MNSFITERDVIKSFTNTGFNFSFYAGSVDWKKIDEIDVDRIVKDGDTDLLSSNICNIINCNLQNDSLKILDKNFIKLFRLAQLTVDYLLHCKKSLEGHVDELSKNIAALNKELEIARNNCHEKKLTIKSLKRKLKDIEATFERKYRQRLLYYSPNHSSGKSHLYNHADGDGKHDRLPGIAPDKFECLCELCGKLFMNKLYLYSHHVRRHLEQLINKNNTNFNHTTVQQDLLISEIKQLKERLNAAELKLRISSSCDFTQPIEAEVLDSNKCAQKNSSEIAGTASPPLLESGEIPQTNLERADARHFNDSKTCKHYDFNESRNKLGSNSYKEDVESLRVMLHNEIKDSKKTGVMWSDERKKAMNE